MFTKSVSKNQSVYDVYLIDYKIIFNFLRDRL